MRLRWRDYADHDRVKILALAVDEFLRRFLIHVLPRGLMRIRHFGLLANRRRHATLLRCRTLLDAPTPTARPSETPVLAVLRCCPSCGATTAPRVEILPPQSWASLATSIDSS